METPPVWKGSSKLFRNLNEKGEGEEFIFLNQIITCINVLWLKWYCTSIWVTASKR